MKVFKFVVQQTPVPDVGVYSGCATVVIEETLEAARRAVHSWGARQDPPDDTRWIDYAEVREIEIVNGTVLLFVME